MFSWSAMANLVKSCFTGYGWVSLWCWHRGVFTTVFQSQIVSTHVKTHNASKIDKTHIYQHMVMCFAFNQKPSFSTHPSPSATQVLCCTSPMHSPCFEQDPPLFGFSAKRCCSEAVLQGSGWEIWEFWVSEWLPSGNLMESNGILMESNGILIHYHPLNGRYPLVI